jgi:hypothetical protein
MTRGPIRRPTSCARPRRGEAAGPAPRHRGDDRLVRLVANKAIGDQRILAEMAAELAPEQVAFGPLLRASWVRGTDGCVSGSYIYEISKS